MLTRKFFIPWLGEPAAQPSSANPRAASAPPVCSQIEGAVVVRYLAQVQRRCSELMAEQARHITTLEQQNLRMQRELLQRDAEIRALRQQISGTTTSELICRTGCLSHDNHWRTDDHCRLKDQPCHHAEDHERLEQDSP